MFEITGTCAGLPVNLLVSVDPEIASDLQVRVMEAVIANLPGLAEQVLDSYRGMLHNPNVMAKAEQLANEISELVQQAQVAAAAARYS